jgi:predicted aldo/keto reductase-like oxidoreductase
MDPESPLQHIAINALNCTQGVGTVLVGMRTPAYVDDVMSVMDLPQQQFTRGTWEEVVKVLRELSE